MPALLGIGAYTAGVLFVASSTRLLAGLACRHRGRARPSAPLLALPALRVTGPYLAMVTLAFGTIVADPDQRD